MTLDCPPEGSLRYLVSLGALLLAGPVHGQVILKLGALAPQGSSWHEILKEMSQRWSAATSGGVVLRVYAGGGTATSAN